MREEDMRIKVLICATLLLAVTAGAGFCEEENKAINKSPFSFLQGFFMGDEYVEYQDKLAKLEESYKEGRLSKEDYAQQKLDLEKSYKLSQR